MISQIFFQSIEPALYVSAACRLYTMHSHVHAPMVHYILVSFCADCALSLLVRALQLYRIYRDKKTSFHDHTGLSIGSNLMPMLLSITSLRYNPGVKIYLLALVVSWLGFAFNLHTLYLVVTPTSSAATHSSYLLSALFLGGIGIFFVSDLFQPTSLDTVCFLYIYAAIQGAFILLYDFSSTPSVLSTGEWIVVSTLLSLLLADYISFLIWPLIQTHGNYPARQVTDEWIVDHLRLAQAGIVGTILACLFLQTPRHARTVLEHRFPKQPLDPTRLSFRIHWKYTQILFNISIAIILIITPVILSPSTWTYSSSAAFFKRVMNPIRWLIDFLKAYEGSFASSQTRTDMIPRFYWLLYWFLVLVLSIPPAVYISRHLSKLPNQKRRKLVVVSRKYFHLIAILLFGPVTYFAPIMMSFSYAVALALLLILEAIRYGAYRAMTNPLHFVQVESSIRTENEIVPTALFHGLNEFYHAFLADHDSHGCVVVTHIFLILGCAFPLWYYLMLHDMFEMQPILPFVGIISLGVGDSIGAIIGVYMGRNFWPGSKRTLEGSLGMFLTTLASMIGFQGWMHQDVPRFKLLSISLAITLLEACTCHIDNLYLPLMSIGFIIME